MCPSYELITSCHSFPPLYSRSHSTNVHCGLHRENPFIAQAAKDASFEITRGKRKVEVAKEMLATSLSQEQTLVQLPPVFAHAITLSTLQVFMRKHADTVKIPAVGNADLGTNALPSYYCGVDEPSRMLSDNIAKLLVEWKTRKFDAKLIENAEVNVHTPSPSQRYSLP